MLLRRLGEAPQSPRKMSLCRAALRQTRKSGLHSTREPERTACWVRHQPLESDTWAGPFPVQCSSVKPDRDSYAGTSLSGLHLRNEADRSFAFMVKYLSLESLRSLRLF